MFIVQSVASTPLMRQHGAMDLHTINQLTALNSSNGDTTTLAATEARADSTSSARAASTSSDSSSNTAPNVG
jgi:hypothetical protein